MRKLIIFAIMLCAFLFASMDLNAQNRPGRHGQKGNKVVVVKKGHPNRFHRKNVVIVRKRPGRVVTVLPNGYTTCVFKKNNYFFHEGFYYRQVNNSYQVVVAPFGLRIRTLPVGYRRVMMYGKPHFYYRGTFYRQVGDEYEAANPEVGTVVPDIPEDVAEQVEAEGITYYEIADYLYKPIQTAEGTQYEVAGRIDDEED